MITMRLAFLVRMEIISELMYRFSGDLISLRIFGLQPILFVQGIYYTKSNTAQCMYNAECIEYVTTVLNAVGTLHFVIIDQCVDQSTALVDCSTASVFLLTLLISSTRCKCMFACTLVTQWHFTKIKESGSLETGQGIPPASK